MVIQRFRPKPSAQNPKNKSFFCMSVQILASKQGWLHIYVSGIISVIRGTTWFDILVRHGERKILELAWRGGCCELTIASNVGILRFLMGQLHMYTRARVWRDKHRLGKSYEVTSSQRTQKVNANSFMLSICNLDVILFTCFIGCFSTVGLFFKMYFYLKIY
jgi:hypothetical protein